LSGRGHGLIQSQADIVKLNLIAAKEKKERQKRGVRRKRGRNERESARVISKGGKLGARPVGGGEERHDEVTAGRAKPKSFT